MIDISRATNIATDYLNNCFLGISDIQLEEIELSEDKNYWFITLSYEINNFPFKNTFQEKTKKLKRFKIESGSGEVISMKIRDLPLLVNI